MYFLQTHGQYFLDTLAFVTSLFVSNILSRQCLLDSNILGRQCLHRSFLQTNIFYNCTRTQAEYVSVFYIQRSVIVNEWNDGTHTIGGYVLVQGLSKAVQLNFEMKTQNPH